VLIALSSIDGVIAAGFAILSAASAHVTILVNSG
jgi:hypothetical protein